MLGESNPSPPPNHQPSNGDMNERLKGLRELPLRVHPSLQGGLPLNLSLLPPLPSLYRCLWGSASSRDLTQSTAPRSSFFLLSKRLLSVCSPTDTHTFKDQRPFLAFIYPRILVSSCCEAGSDSRGSHFTVSHYISQHFTDIQRPRRTRT